LSRNFFKLFEGAVVCPSRSVLKSAGGSIVFLGGAQHDSLRFAVFLGQGSTSFFQPNTRLGFTTKKFERIVFRTIHESGCSIHEVTQNLQMKTRSNHGGTANICIFTRARGEPTGFGGQADELAYIDQGHVILPKSNAPNRFCNSLFDMRSRNLALVSKQQQIRLLPPHVNSAWRSFVAHLHHSLIASEMNELSTILSQAWEKNTQPR
ncbi:MAG TPA: hypothetical protein PK156_28465, partial [Polyangium sp.]|nr:hypothetical protein [Polyangium sp.]